MPIYEYEHTEGHSSPCLKDRIEIVQKMSDATLSICPYCAKPIRKLISMPAKHQQAQSNTLSDENIKKQGFTKYEKVGDGLYEKAAGPDEAPDILDKRVMRDNLPDTDQIN